MHSVVPSQQQQQHHQQQSNDNGIGKTPARSVTRRALGDISNRKVSIAAPFNDNIGSKTPLVKKNATTTTSIYKETSKSAVKEVNPEVLRNTTSTNNQQLQLPNHLSSLRVTTTAATTTNRNKSNNVTFILPDDTQNHQARRIHSVLPAPQRRITVLNHINSKHHSNLWNYDDESEMELPAGRLYHQQLLMYDDNDNDSQLSLEGAKTFREDFMKVLLEEHNEAMQEKESYIQYCIEQLEQNCIITDDGTCDTQIYESWKLVIGRSLRIHIHIYMCKTTDIR